MSGLLFIAFIIAAYWLITASSRRKRPRARDAAYFHSSGFTKTRRYFDPSVLNGARPWKR
ncbi:hypothetical protein [Rhizobium sp. BK176]|uniref:hypothetical protein n=1 Tax=Rhizobium sp. BK176 TaxID=2587071 RepID=UPI0021679268|nr:hypothetical protein [Rhizobium sp. BK176]MCS4088597.1 hypothetical protein [Rhizobium sp. BK176]